MVKKLTDMAKSTSKTMTSGIIAIDNGGYNTKVLSGNLSEPIVISSKKAFGHNNLSLGASYPEGTYKVLWNDEYYFFGSLLHESTSFMNGFVNTKSKDYFILSALHAIALWGYDINYVVTSVPIARYTLEETEKITQRLLGKHSLVINDVEHVFTVKDVLVAPETSSAFFAETPDGYTRWLDLGSRTIGYATINADLESDSWFPIERESGTIEKEGLDITRIAEEAKTVRDFERYVESFSTELNRSWKDDDVVIVFGGGALIPKLVEAVQNIYVNAVVPNEPHLLQVRGLYNLATLHFGGELEDE